MIARILLIYVFIGGLAACADRPLVHNEPSPFEGLKMEEEKEHPLHFFVSNQSPAIPFSNLEISVDGRTIFHREMTTGTQHNWGEVTIPAAGKVTLVINESRTQTRRTEVVDVDRERWVVVTFHGPPARLKVEIFDHPVAFM